MNGKPNYQKQVQWYLTLDGILPDILELGARSDDLADEAFKQGTIGEVLNLFPEKMHLKLTTLVKINNIKEHLKRYRTDAQTLDKVRRGENGGDNQTVVVGGQTWPSKADVVLYDIPPLYFGRVRRGRLEEKAEILYGDFAAEQSRASNSAPSYFGCF